MGEYKSIEYKEKEVEITHYILEEYEEETSNENLTYEMYKEGIKKSYELGERLNLCKIIEIKKKTMKIRMPRYSILLENIVKDRLASQTHPGPTKNESELVEQQTGEERVRTVVKDVFEEKMKNLLIWMYENKIIHLDLAPRNIGIDDKGDYQLIDLNDIYELNTDKDFIELIKFSYFEFKHTGLGKEYRKIQKYWKERLNM